MTIRRRSKIKRKIEDITLCLWLYFTRDNGLLEKNTGDAGNTGKN